MTWQVQHSSCLSTVLLAQEELLGDFRIYFVQCDEARPAGAQFDNMMTFLRCARLAIAAPLSSDCRDQADPSRSF